MKNQAFLQVVLNVVLFLPFGVFVRLITHRGVVVATVLGFAVSLLIEVTQLTGVWGVYPCAYRLFDVDDLLTNTLGAFLGAVLSAPYAAAGAADWVRPVGRCRPRCRRGAGSRGPRATCSSWCWPGRPRRLCAATSSSPRTSVRPRTRRP